MSGYKTQSPDTSPEVEQFLFDYWRSLDSRAKSRIISDHIATAEALCVAGIRARHPDATDRELQLRLFALKHGRQLSIDVWGWDPDEHGW